MKKTESFIAVRRGNEVERPLDPDAIYLWGCESETGPPFAALFLCPCGCGKEISIRVTSGDPDGHPCWRYEMCEDGTITLSPSILQKFDCKAHFFIRGGKVVWA